MRRIDSATVRRLVLVTAGVAYVALMWREIITHDKWRDEGIVWLMAKESSSPIDVIQRMREYGKPPGWTLLLWVLTRLSGSYAAIKIIPLLTAPLMAWIVLRHRRLTLLERIGVLSTFLFTGGYMVLSRDYIVMLLVLVALVLHLNLEIASWRLMIVLALFAMINFFSFVITAAILGAHLMVEVGRPLLRGRAPAWRRIVPVALPAAVMAISLVGFIPSDDNTVAAARGSGDLPVRIALMRAITWTFVPFRWNMWGFEKGEEIAALVVVALILWVAWRHSTWLGWWATLGLALLLGNHVYGHAPEWRHRLAMTAFAFGVYLCARRGGSRGLAVVALGVGLVVPQIFAQRWGAGYEIYHERPFSNAGRTAAVVARECGEGCTVVGDWGGVVESVSAHLDGRRIFYVNRDEFGTYATYVPDRVEVTWDAARRAIERFPDAVLVTSILQDPVPADFGLVAEFTGSLAGLEDFAVYRRIDTTVSP
jgi:hypothetical protein